MADTELKHIGLILDGNRRWARNRGLPTLEGHRKGYENLRDICEHAFSRGVEFVSAYIFSTENWKRSEEEVGYLMDLALWIASNELKKMHEKNFRVVFLGSRERLTPKLVKAIDKAETTTANNTGGTIALCFNYGGQQEIADAFNAMLREGVEGPVTPETIGKYIYHPEVPPVDLVVRTSGEQRLSNFMLWRICYSELLFVNKHWPDFSGQDLDEAIAWYAERDRRLGS